MHDSELQFFTGQLQGLWVTDAYLIFSELWLNLDAKDGRQEVPLELFLASCFWRIGRRDEILVARGDSSQKLASAPALLLSSSIESVEIRSQALDTRFSFGGKPCHRGKTVPYVVGRSFLVQLEKLRAATYVEPGMVVQLPYALGDPRQVAIWSERADNERSSLFVYLPLIRQIWEPR